MHFSYAHQDSARTATRIAIVAAVHIVVGGVLLQGMNKRFISDPFPPGDITVYQPERTPPPLPTPTELPQTRQKLPDLFVPKPDVEVKQQPLADVPQARRADPPVDSGSREPVSLKADPGPAAKPQPAMRSAVLVNANGCALPDYPARAARNGETGTVALALLVGVNGRVVDSKVLSSSGSRELDRAAQSALSLCSFQPAMEGGQPQQAWAQIAYVWKLD